jgi:hypothetical protein
MALTDRIALCLLSDLKDDLGITDSASDSKLERRILAASAMIERYCSRSFRRQVARVEILPGHGTCRLLPSLRPIVSVSEVALDGDIVDPSSYTVETTSSGEGWSIFAEDGWLWTAPGVQTIDSIPVPLPGSERSAYSVTYTAGYALPNDTDQTAPLLPFEVAEACTLLAAHLWRRRGVDGDVVSESDGDASVSRGAIGGVSSADFGGIPPAIAAMVDAYRRIA